MTLLTSKPQIVLRNGKPRSVVLDIADYERLLETAEEKEDLAELHRIKKTKTSFRSLTDYFRKRV